MATVTEAAAATAAMTAVTAAANDGGGVGALTHPEFGVHHYRMCKKIAQLTKVIYQLNITNEDNDAYVAAIVAQHARSLSARTQQHSVETQALKDSLTTCQESVESLTSSLAQALLEHELAAQRAAALHQQTEHKLKSALSAVDQQISQCRALEVGNAGLAAEIESLNQKVDAAERRASDDQRAASEKDSDRISMMDTHKRREDALLERIGLLEAAKHDALESCSELQHCIVELELASSEVLARAQNEQLHANDTIADLRARLSSAQMEVKVLRQTSDANGSAASLYSEALNTIAEQKETLREKVQLIDELSTSIRSAEFRGDELQRQCAKLESESRESASLLVEEQSAKGDLQQQLAELRTAADSASAAADAQYEAAVKEHEAAMLRSQQAAEDAVAAGTNAGATRMALLEETVASLHEKLEKQSDEHSATMTRLSHDSDSSVLMLTTERDAASRLALEQQIALAALQVLLEERDAQHCADLKAEQERAASVRNTNDATSHALAAAQQEIVELRERMNAASSHIAALQQTNEANEAALLSARSALEISNRAAHAAEAAATAADERAAHVRSTLQREVQSLTEQLESTSSASSDALRVMRAGFEADMARAQHTLTAEYLRRDEEARARISSLEQQLNNSEVEARRATDESRNVHTTLRAQLEQMQHDSEQERSALSLKHTQQLADTNATWTAKYQTSLEHTAAEAEARFAERLRRKIEEVNRAATIETELQAAQLAAAVGAHQATQVSLDTARAAAQRTDRTLAARSQQLEAANQRGSELEGAIVRLEQQLHDAEVNISELSRSIEVARIESADRAAASQQIFAKEIAAQHEAHLGAQELANRTHEDELQRCACDAYARELS